METCMAVASRHYIRFFECAVVGHSRHTRPCTTNIHAQCVIHHCQPCPPPLQRTGLSKENALLRAQLEVLRQQNQELSSRLKATEGKLSGQNSAAATAAAAPSTKYKAFGESGGLLVQELEAMRVTLERTEAARAQAVAEAGECAVLVVGTRRCWA